MVSLCFQTPLNATLSSLVHISWYFINFLLLPLLHIILPSLGQVVKALDVLYELLRSSPPREQVQTVLLEWGVEQLYSLLLSSSFGDEARERVFRVRTNGSTHASLFFLLATPLVIYCLTQFPRAVLQILYKILKSERVSERNKQRIKLKDFGYLGLVCCLEDIPVTMTTVRCLYEQVLATGNVKTGVCLKLKKHLRLLMLRNNEARVAKSP